MKEQALLCYRGACNNTAHVCGYNRVTQGLYCLDCAHKAQSHPLSADVPGGPFYPILHLANALPEGGQFNPGLVVVRTQPTVVVAKHIGTVNL